MDYESVALTIELRALKLSICQAYIHKFVNDLPLAGAIL